MTGKTIDVKELRRGGGWVQVWILSASLLFLCCQNNLNAQTQINLSATANYEVTSGYFPGYDFTILVNGAWGVRFTHLSDFYFENQGKLITDNTSVSLHTIQGSLDIPMFLKLIDYSTHYNQKSIPFDYLTAYVGWGYNILKPELTQRKFRPQNGIIVEQQICETVEMPMMAIAFGFTGGERFLVIDGRVLYVKGVLDNSQILEADFEFDQWLILFSIGIGF